MQSSAFLRILEILLVIIKAVLDHTSKNGARAVSVVQLSICWKCLLLQMGEEIRGGFLLPYRA